MEPFRFLHPADPLSPRRIDEMFAPEAAALREAGFATSVVELEALPAGQPRLTPPIDSGERVVYRASPFFSVDVALREDGAERIVEIGDGQVSDLVGWSPERFAEMWRAVGAMIFPAYDEEKWTGAAAR